MYACPRTQQSVALQESRFQRHVQQRVRDAGSGRPARTQHSRGPLTGRGPSRCLGRELRPENPPWIQHTLCS